MNTQTREELSALADTETSLDLELPAQPQALMQLSLLMVDDDIRLPDAAALIETDMALASSVMKAVNSSLYGVQGRVSSVHQAITYLGLREVAAITFEMGLRAAFPPAPELEPLWQRAGPRGRLMSQLAQRLGLDAWAAFSAGLFEECGKAVLFKHASVHYRSMLRAASDDAQLVQLEQTGFGIGHDALGAALCESWGLGEVAVACVRLHVLAQHAKDLRAALDDAQCAMLVVSSLARVLMLAPTDIEAAEALALVLASQAGLDEEGLLRALRQTQAQQIAAKAHTRQ